MLKSIKFKLVIWCLAVFSLVFAGLEIYLYYKLEGVVISLVDDHLSTSVQSLANLLTIEEAHGQLEKELAELSSTATGDYAKSLSGHYYQVLSPDGEVVVRSPSLSISGASLPAMKGITETAKYETVTGPAGERMRMITKPVRYAVGHLTFQAADDLADTYLLVISFRNIILYIFPAVFILTIGGVFVITGVALKPLKRFSSKLGQITEENLNARVDSDGLDDELAPLASSFNMMLARLEGSFSRQKQFLSDASHELRTPTSIIRSYCDVTLGKERTVKEYKETLNKVSTSVNRMCEIINRILVISRLDAKTIEWKPARIDLFDIMKDVVKLLEPAAAGKDVVLKLKGVSAVVKGDREGLTEALTNIVENAIKYNKPDGRVDMTVKEDGGIAPFGEFAVVSVADTGIGIPEGEREKIFDRFYRVDASRGVTVGSGLGLSIVRTIVEAHGGGIEVESETGRGSTFVVRLPKNLDLKNGD
ncbi:MAG: HAMP domain-containing protein [Deltaproteobacteria bacterium]|nr:HAMP domain-containing protein [Deltaproteobacteria bacterium]